MSENKKVKDRKPAEIADSDQIETIKKIAIAAMFSDDELMDQLVLKGGNAMEIIHHTNSRASVDLDFSIASDFDINKVGKQVEIALKRTFEMEKYLAFDVKMSPRPGKMPDELSQFWGGYLIEFKLMSLERADRLHREQEAMRREAIRLGEGTKFTIDISRHEYTEGKQPHDLFGYQIYVYSPVMIVCEKLRAICQQMPEYGGIIKRNSAGNQRARDFIDIEVLVRQFDIDMASVNVGQTVSQMFEMKRVPLEFIPQIENTKDFHSLGFEGVKATMRPGIEIRPFDYYFQFVVEQCRKLEPLWNV